MAMILENTGGPGAPPLNDFNMGWNTGVRLHAAVTKYTDTHNRNATKR